MFTHLIYIVEDPVDPLIFFDPLRDLLVSERSYLAWRRVDQDTPSGRCKVYGAIYKTYEENDYVSWNLVQFDVRRSFPGIYRWLRREGSRFPKNRLGKHESTNCRGLLFSIIRPTSQDSRLAYHEKTELLHKVVEELQIRLFPSYDPEPKNSSSEWTRVRNQLILGLLDMNQESENATS